MRTLKPFAESEGSRLADYAARLSETLVRQRAELAVRAARIEAELAIKARSEFLANMNHELRTPLNAIIGFATMLRDSDTYQVGPEQRTSYAEYILQSADLLLGHINTILEVASLESGRVEVDDEIVDVNEIIDGAIRRAEVRARAADVTINRIGEGETLLGWGDAQRFGQALDHMLQTAVKLSAKGGGVRVSASANAFGWTEVSVQDDGAGFTADEIETALDAFSEVHRGLDRSFLGPGVGYAVAKTFVEMQGGRFSIESSKGAGTTVRAALPPACREDRPARDQTAVAERSHDAA